MEAIYRELCAVLWLAWLISWNVAAFWRAKSSAEAPRNQYRLHFAIAVFGFMLAFGTFSWRVPPLWPVSPALGWAMVGLTAIGLAFTWWARVHMGRLWHGGVSRTPEHRVIDTGPFALVRHPIYTGMMTAVAAVAVLQAQPLALLGAGLFALGFGLKARVEERFLEREIGGYEAYRRRVGMLVPWLGRAKPEPGA
jgi:protein-S-isoprenylcysteine O-methyltransferase Ste14